jgi:CHAD domain-containing protein
MSIDLERAAKPVRTLRMLLKRVRPNPSPDQVHELRTTTRELEAMLHAISAEFGDEPRRIMKLVKPVRRAAGRVRDMDVLIAKAASLTAHDQTDATTRLLRHMTSMRAEGAKKLYGAMKQHCRKARSRLKGCLRRIERMDNDRPERVSRAIQILAEQIDRWPRLDQENLHGFRKRVKELRYMLHLVRDEDCQFINAVAKVKDLAGDWHDWRELESVAGSVLSSRDHATTLEAIKEIVRDKLRIALAAANALRKRGFELPTAA